MSHYTKNVQSLLTGGFKVLNVILKSKFSVEDKTKELCFFDYFYRRFSQKNVRVWGEKTCCWWKWIQTVLEMENHHFRDTKETRNFPAIFVGLKTGAKTKKRWLVDAILSFGVFVRAFPTQVLTISTKSFEPQFWWCRQNMQRDHITWLIVAIWSRCQDVYVPENVQIDSYMCATCHAFIPFCNVHPGILTIRAPLNGDQLCGHVYVAWPNYSNHCCRQQIKVSWD